MNAPRFYLDHNATTPLDPRVRAAMEPFLGGGGNPSSLHAEGRKARGAIDMARDQLADWLGVKPSELIFTSGGTESNNLAIQGLARAHRNKGNHLITCQTEHHAVLQTFQALERQGFRVTYLPVQPDGLIRLQDLEAAIQPDTILVSIMSANNETGVKQLIAEIGRICSEKKVMFHTDAVQSAGKEPLLIREWKVQALSLTAHKLFGPIGAGLLYLEGGLPLEKLFFGGAHENERRPGTENTAAIVGLATAALLSDEKLEAESKRQHAWIENLWSRLQDLPGIQRNGNAAQRISNTLNVSFSNLHGEDLLMGLDLAGIAVSSGSACLVGSVQTSHVLQAMGVPDSTAQSTVRFSIGRQTRDEDLDVIAERVRRVVLHQQKIQIAA